MTPLPALGSTFSGYRLDTQIARGGMGIVYAATHLRLSRTVALKLLAPELAEDQDFRTRFLKEAQLAASLEHPSVVPVYDAGEEQGLLYLAMRYLQGGDLRGLLQRQGRLSLERSLQITQQVAGALDAAHARGLVHRDVKPANILFDEAQERAYLGDFGVAKRQSSKGLTQTGSFLGSVDYCAPEQIESALVDGRADIYALGGVFYHCLTGQPPYVRETEVAVLTAHLRDPPPALSRVRPDLPEALDGVVVTAMAKHPQVRYATAGEFAGALREALSSPHSAAPVASASAAVELAATVQGQAPVQYQIREPTTERTRDEANRRRSVLVTSLVVALAALAAVAGAALALLVATDRESAAADSTTTATRQQASTGSTPTRTETSPQVSTVTVTTTTAVERPEPVAAPGVDYDVIAYSGGDPVALRYSPSTWCYQSSGSPVPRSDPCWDDVVPGSFTPPGQRMTIYCYARGVEVKGNPWWAKVATDPHKYIPATFLEGGHFGRPSGAPLC